MKKRLLLVTILLLLSILLVTEHFVKPMVVKPIETGKTGGESIMNYLESNENVLTCAST
jgi:hypothetical protein